MNWIIDDPEFSCGWVSPEGHTFSCARNGHEKLARYLLLHVVNGVHSRQKVFAERRLDDGSCTRLVRLLRR